MSRRLLAGSGLILLGTLLAGCGSGRPAGRIGSPPLSYRMTTLNRYVDRRGWRLTYPSAFHLEHSRSPGFIRILVDEVTVASFRMRSPIRAHSSKTGSSMRVLPPQNARGRFPADGVALRMYFQAGGPAPDLELAESHFPLRLSSLRRSDAYGNSSTPPALERTVVADGSTYTLQAWIGPKAPAVERLRLKQTVASLAFPRLRVGATAGGFKVFGPARRYPVGSFTRIPVQGQPFYLVHAPGGWYAVGWTWQSLEGGYKSGCRLRLDRATKQFFCTNIRARWDRMGRVLVKPSDARRGDPLNLTIAKVAWDGHVLVTPDVARFADAGYARHFWPRGYRGLRARP